jgi:hypothetical protein
MCECAPTNVCPVTTATSSGCDVGTYAIAHSGGGFLCLKFGTSTALQLPDADSATASAMVPLTGDHLTATIGTESFTFDFGAVATSGGGTKLRLLMLVNDHGAGVLYTACGPFMLQNRQNKRKRDISVQEMTTGLGNMVTSASASGDPHLAGANGITFDVYGKPSANYSLLVAPAFEINMQLADRGPEMRFMTSMAVLYQGTSFIITPWTVKGKRNELIAHFDALGAKVRIDANNWIITIELCAHHTIVFSTRHSDNINFLNLEVRVPGCHNAYGGLLGQTYQCKYAREKFEWSREREEAFRVATLETASDTYSPLATCAHEDEYRGEAIRGGSNGGGNRTLEIAQRASLSSQTFIFCNTHVLFSFSFSPQGDFESE